MSHPRTWPPGTHIEPTHKVPGRTTRRLLRRSHHHDEDGWWTGRLSGGGQVFLSDTTLTRYWTPKTENDMTKIKSKDLKPGDKIRPTHYTRSDIRVVEQRKDTGDGWWLRTEDGKYPAGGISDVAFDNQAWVKVEDTVEVPVSLLERLRDADREAQVGVGRDVPIIQALINCLPPDPRQEKVDALAKVLAGAFSIRITWEDISEIGKDEYRTMAKAALDHLEGES